MCHGTGLKPCTTHFNVRVEAHQGRGCYKILQLKNVAVWVICDNWLHINVLGYK